jgi:hypothetical protein
MILIFMSFIILWNSLLLKNTCIALFFIKPSVPASLYLYRKANNIPALQSKMLEPRKCSPVYQMNTLEGLLTF